MQQSNNIIFLEKIDSTHKYALRNFYDLDDKIMISSKEQTAGIGRFKRIWISPIGGVYITYLLKKNIRYENIKYYSIIGCISTLEIIKKFIKNDVWIKLPNDIYHKNKKLAGILCETITEKTNNNIIGIAISIGINLNVNVNNLNNIKSTSVSFILNKNLNNDIYDTIFKLYKKINYYIYILQNNREEIMKNWISKNRFLLNKDIDIFDNKSNNTISGKIIEILKNGDLSIKSNNKIYILPILSNKFSVKINE